ncbi:unnamed protein product [Coregonus sp. 'balchen']|nr:unnamed protein product [Coregonus sp. 'balchen']
MAGYESSSTLMSSELETTSFFDSEDDDATSRFSGSTQQSTSSRLVRRHRRRRKPKAPQMERSSSFSSVTDSTMSLNIITVTLNMGEPIRPIDPAAWVSHTAAMTGAYPVYGFDDFHLSIHSEMATIAKAMANPESGLEVRDRMWLKITIPSAFIGSDVVDWLYHYVEGFTDRREARKYASNLLKAGYIRHTVNKITFSEQCYYIFGDLCGSECKIDMANLSLGDHDGSSGASDQDTLAPLPHPGAAPWPLAFPYQYPIPHPLHEPPQSQPGRGGGAGSQHSEGEMLRVHSTHSHSGSLVYGPPGLPAQPPPSLPTTAPPGSPPGRDLASVPPELTASRQSFRMAMGNPSEFFVDVM